MLVDNNSPQLMPVPQNVTMIQSPTPMIQVMPAAFQPVPYFPATIIPSGSTTPLEFVPVGMPQLVVNPVGAFPGQQTPAPVASQSPMSIKFKGSGQFDVQMGNQGQVVIPQQGGMVPYVVQARNGGMVATSVLNGLDDAPSSPITLIALAALVYFALKK